MCWKDRIELNPKVLVGKPVIRGTRISVELVIERLADGWTTEQLVDAYPHITTDDVRACLRYARELVLSERVYPLKI